MTAKLVDLESARLRRWEKKRDDPFKKRDDGSVVWVCNCGCWQYELRPIGAFCVSCGAKQSIAIKM